MYRITLFPISQLGRKKYYINVVYVYSVSVMTVNWNNVLFDIILDSFSLDSVFLNKKKIYVKFSFYAFSFGCPLERNISLYKEKTTMESLQICNNSYFDLWANSAKRHSPKKHMNVKIRYSIIPNQKSNHVNEFFRNRFQSTSHICRQNFQNTCLNRISKVI